MTRWQQDRIRLASQILRVSDVAYETSDDSVEAPILLDPGESYVEIPGPTEVIWDDGAVTEAAPILRGGEIEVTTGRSDEALDAEVIEIRFEQLARSLEIDESATVGQAQIATRWGGIAYSVAGTSLAGDRG